MLLEALREYALNSLDLRPAGYQRQPIGYIILLSADGRYLQTIDTAGPENQNRGTPQLAPAIKRSSRIAPKLLADTGEYVLGIPRDDPKNPAKPQRVAEQHQAFVALVQSCAEQTGEPAVRAVSTFLQGPLPTRDQLPANFDPGATITFRIVDPQHPEGVLPISLPSVQAFWAAYLAPEADATRPHMSCMVCGRVGPVLERHPLKVSGIPGGQPGKDLISANEEAFESYGLQASETAPMCPQCAEAYGNALNALLADKTTSYRTKDSAYAFWVAEAGNDMGQIIVGLLVEPEAHAGEVRELLRSYRTGQTSSLALDPVRFYAVALGASGARIVVRDWIDITVGEARRHLARYFALQELVQQNGTASTPLPLSWLANATVHRTATPPPIVSKSLVRLALAGDPLPLDLLFLAIRRNRAEQDVTRERAILIKMVLESRDPLYQREDDKMTELDPGEFRPAYLCGRLLATLDRVQQIALGSPNATIIDKYYGSASSAPASVFGTLIHGAQNHLGKLRREKPGAYRALELELQEIMAPLTSFPLTLTLEEQGLFALGFYHQRAAHRARAIENRAKRDAGAPDQQAMALPESDEPTEV